MRVCYFGIYNPNYSRNKLLMFGLRKNGVEIIECRSDKKGISKYFDLIRKHRDIKGGYDVMIVGYPGFQCAILAKFLTRKSIIFDAFVSIYDSVILDRKEAARFSLASAYYWMLDKISFSLADVILFDTMEHAQYASKKFGVPMRKFRRIFLGADTKIFFPRESGSNNKTFKVFFYGHYIPLQGVEYIVRAAKLLQDNKDIIFEIVGDGPGKEKIVGMADSLKLDNLYFVGEMSLENLADKISKADVCLGIFGNTGKATRVIPNKVYQYVAMKKPVITSDTPAIRELFDDKDMYLVEISNPQKIAEAILSMKSDADKASFFIGRAYDKFMKNALPEKTGFELKNIIQEFL